MAGFPVTERTLKDYLAKARKDAKDENLDYSDLKERILSQAGKEESKNCANNAAPFLSGDNASDAKDASVVFAVPSDEEPASAITSASDDTEEAEKNTSRISIRPENTESRPETLKSADTLLIAQ